jgi:hypothetical protein
VQNSQDKRLLQKVALNINLSFRQDVLAYSVTSLSERGFQSENVLVCIESVYLTDPDSFLDVFAFSDRLPC